MRKVTVLFSISTSFLIISCNSFFYYPNDTIYKKNIDLKHDELFLNSRSGNRLNYYYFQAKNPRGLIVHYHGNARNISAHYKAFAWAIEEGYDLISWDYSGYGKSTGYAHREVINEDSLTMLELAAEIKKRKGYKLILIGQSLGGAVLLGSLGEFKGISNVDFLMVDCTFPSYVEMGGYLVNRYMKLPVKIGKILVSDEHAPRKSFNKIKNIPILVTHCREDEVIPFTFGEKLYRELESSDKTFLELSCKHTAGFWNKKNQQWLIRFINKKLQQSKN